MPPPVAFHSATWVAEMAEARRRNDRSGVETLLARAKATTRELLNTDPLLVTHEGGHPALIARAGSPLGELLAANLAPVVSQYLTVFSPENVTWLLDTLLASEKNVARLEHQVTRAWDDYRLAWDLVNRLETGLRALWEAVRQVIAQVSAARRARTGLTLRQLDEWFAMLAAHLARDKDFQAITEECPF